MIDTDKYEGHTEGPWVWSSLNDEELIMFDVERAKPNIILRAKEDDADAQLIADAPLLLEAYQKRLKNVILMREEIRKLNKIIHFAWEVMDDQTQVEFNDLIIELEGEEE